MTRRQAYIATLKYEFQSMLVEFQPCGRFELSVARAYWVRAKAKAEKRMSTHMLTWLEARL